jgi:hypothetical protein
MPARGRPDRIRQPARQRNRRQWRTLRQALRHGLHDHRSVALSAGRRTQGPTNPGLLDPGTKNPFRVPSWRRDHACCARSGAAGDPGRPRDGAGRRGLREALRQRRRPPRPGRRHRHPGDGPRRLPRPPRPPVRAAREAPGRMVRPGDGRRAPDHDARPIAAREERRGGGRDGGHPQAERQAEGAGGDGDREPLERLESGGDRRPAGAPMRAARRSPRTGACVGSRTRDRARCVRVCEAGGP